MAAVAEIVSINFLAPYYLLHYKDLFTNLRPFEVIFLQLLPYFNLNHSKKGPFPLCPRLFQCLGGFFHVWGLSP